jgi:hypothetical protein
LQGFIVYFATLKAKQGWLIHQVHQQAELAPMEGGFVTYVNFFNLPTATYLLFVGD